MKRLAETVLIIMFCVACFLLFSPQLWTQQTPPIPPPLQPLTVTVAWEHLPAWEHYRAVDTNGNPVPLMYRVYYATNVVGPWEVRAAVTNNRAMITNVHRVTGFFYVTASNVFLESDRSELLSLPMDKVSSPTFIAP